MRSFGITETRPGYRSLGGVMYQFHDDTSRIHKVQMVRNHPGLSLDPARFLFLNVENYWSDGECEFRIEVLGQRAHVCVLPPRASTLVQLPVRDGMMLTLTCGGEQLVIDVYEQESPGMPLPPRTEVGRLQTVAA